MSDPLVVLRFGAVLKYFFHNLPISIIYPVRGVTLYYNLACS